MPKDGSLKLGLKKTKIYYVWRGMNERCHPRFKDSKKYRWHAGKGIKVCERWHFFEYFLDDVYESYVEHMYDNESTTLDRIDGNKDYSPENCRWATWEEQVSNRGGKTALKFYQFEGKKLTLDEWSKEKNIKKITLRARINNLGWSLEKSLTTPAIPTRLYT